MKRGRLLVCIGLGVVLDGQALHDQRSEADGQALAQLRANAETGEAKSQFELGLAFYSGTFGLATNYVEAVKCFLKAAEHNYARAQYNLGWAYCEGKGVAIDYVEAAKWWRRAAEQNDALAQNSLGLCYERGDGVAKYEVEAYKWNLLAAVQGDTKAKRNAAMLELLLSREQVTEGKQGAQTWLEQRIQAPATNRCTE